MYLFYYVLIDILTCLLYKEFMYKKSNRKNFTYSKLIMCMTISYIWLSFTQ